MVRCVNSRGKLVVKKSLGKCLRPVGGEVSPGHDEMRHVACRSGCASDVSGKHRRFQGCQASRLVAWRGSSRIPSLAQQKSSQLVDHRRVARDETISNPVDRLQVQLVICLDRNEAYVLSLDCFGYSLRIDEVAVVGLYERLHERRRNQTNFVALLAQRSTEEVSTGAGLQTNQGCLHVRREG